MTETIDNIVLWFDLTVLTDEISNPEPDTQTALDIGSLDIPVFPSLQAMPNKPPRYFAIGNQEKYTLYGILPNGRYKEIWKNK